MFTVQVKSIQKNSMRVWKEGFETLNLIIEQPRPQLIKGVWKGNILEMSPFNQTTKGGSFSKKYIEPFEIQDNLVIFGFH